MDDDSTEDLTSPMERDRRVALLTGPNFVPLQLYIEDIAARFGTTPSVDPMDGGVGASLLLLLETPGPRGVPPRFVSRDNSGGTARNLRRFMQAARIGRQESVLWNVVPWIIHAEGARNRAPRRAEIEAGLALLPSFLTLLPQLRVVVTAGRVAALATPMLRETRPDLALFAMPHPSPTYVNTSPTVTTRIMAALDEASVFLRTQPTGSAATSTRR